MILTIDAGNSRIKWAVFDATDTALRRGVISHGELASLSFLDAWAGCRRAVIANVAGEQLAHRLKMLLDPAMTQQWVVAEAHGCGIVNDYQPPESLGSDRWAAMVGARHLGRQRCLVVNAGTALTIDVLQYSPASSEHRFAGGVILPGYRLMQQALLHGTRGVRQALGMLPQLDDDDVPPLPRDTRHAVAGGALLAMTGAVERMLVNAAAQGDSGFDCVLCGGDAGRLYGPLRSAASFNDIVVVEDLVLRGLLVMGRRAS